MVLESRIEQVFEWQVILIKVSKTWTQHLLNSHHHMTSIHKSPKCSFKMKTSYARHPFNFLLIWFQYLLKTRNFRQAKKLTGHRINIPAEILSKKRQRSEKSKKLNLNAQQILLSHKNFPGSFGRSQNLMPVDKVLEQTLEQVSSGWTEYSQKSAAKIREP